MKDKNKTEELEDVVFFAQKVFNRKIISTHAKIRRYKATVGNAILYAVKTITLGRTTRLNNWRKRKENP